jgi:hypothetical protein
MPNCCPCSSSGARSHGYLGGTWSFAVVSSTSTARRRASTYCCGGRGRVALAQEPGAASHASSPGTHAWGCCCPPKLERAANGNGPVERRRAVGDGEGRRTNPVGGPPPTRDTWRANLKPVNRLIPNFRYQIDTHCRSGQARLAIPALEPLPVVHGHARRQIRRSLLSRGVQAW